MLRISGEQAFFFRIDETRRLAHDSHVSRV